MTASKKPANPTMALPLDPSKIKVEDKGKELAEIIGQQLSRVCVSEFVNSVEGKSRERLRRRCRV